MNTATTTHLTYDLLTLEITWLSESLSQKSSTTAKVRATQDTTFKMWLTYNAYTHFTVTILWFYEAPRKNLTVYIKWTNIINISDILCFHIELNDRDVIYLGLTTLNIKVVLFNQICLQICWYIYLYHTTSATNISIKSENSNKYTVFKQIQILQIWTFNKTGNINLSLQTRLTDYRDRHNGYSACRPIKDVCYESCGKAILAISVTAVCT
jgi:hypothetical protein